MLIGDIFTTTDNDNGNAKDSLDSITFLKLIGMENLLEFLRPGQMLTWHLMKMTQLYSVSRILVQVLFLHS